VQCHHVGREVDSIDQLTAFQSRAQERQRFLFSRQSRLMQRDETADTFTIFTVEQAY